MHAQILLKDDGVHFVVASFESTPQNTESGEVQKRLGLLMTWLGREEFRPLKVNAEFKEDLSTVATWASPKCLDFVGYAVLNHWLLPIEAREMREAAVDQVIAKHFGPDAGVSLNNGQKVSVGKIRSCMKAVPTVLLQGEVGKMCWFVKTWLIHTEVGQVLAKKLPEDQCQAELEAFFERLNPHATKIRVRFPPEVPVKERIAAAMWADEYSKGFSPEDHRIFCEAVSRLAASQQGFEWLRSFIAHWQTKLQQGLSKCFAPHFVLRMLVALDEAVAKGTAPETNDDFLDFFAERFRSDAEARAVLSEQAHIQTLEMVLRNELKLSPTDTAAARQVVLKIFKQRVGRSNFMAAGLDDPNRSDESLRNPGSGVGRGHPGRGRQPKGRGQAMTVKPDQGEMATPMRRSGWSIDQYVEWIEGPVARKAQIPVNAAAAAETYNQQTKVRHDEQLRMLAVQSADTPVHTKLAEPQSMSTVEAQAIIQEALHRTLDFIAAALDDLLELKAKRAVKPEMPELESDRECLRALKCQQPIDEMAARAAFGDIWAHFEETRAAIKAEQASRPSQLSERVYRKFTQALWTALAEEALAPGKSTGGVVLIEADPMQYWSRIAHEFHNRRVILAKAGHVIPEGEERNNALALYVTLGSRTPGVSFCISVHRWRRKPGSTAPPAGPDTHLMDEANWTDTLDTCCVLHVRSAALTTSTSQTSL